MHVACLKFGRGGVRSGLEVSASNGFLMQGFTLIFVLFPSLKLADVTHYLRIRLSESSLIPMSYLSFALACFIGFVAADAPTRQVKKISILLSSFLKTKKVKIFPLMSKSMSTNYLCQHQYIVEILILKILLNRFFLEQFWSSPPTPVFTCKRYL